MIQDHILQKVSFRQTPNISGQSIVPEYLIIHYSASGSTGTTVNHLCDPNADVSAHLVIGRDGEVVQLASFDQRAWHCGESEWSGIRNLNSRSIGIELVNWGPLDLDKDGRYRSWAGTEVPEEEAKMATHRITKEARFWQTYTEPQLRRCFEVAKELVAHYGLKDVLGHEDIAPTRKTDPGPLFPLDDLKKACFPPKVDAQIRTWYANDEFQMDYVPESGVIVSYFTPDGGEGVVGLSMEKAASLRDWLNQILK